MGHVLVDDDTLDEGSVFERTSDLAVDLDELKIDIAALEVGNREDRFNSDGSEFVVRDRNTMEYSEVWLAGRIDSLECPDYGDIHLATQRGLGGLHQI